MNKEKMLKLTKTLVVVYMSLTFLSILLPDEFVIGIQNCNERNFVDADLRLLSYYEYLDNECSFDELVENLRKYEGEV